MPSFDKFATRLFLILLSQIIIAQNTRDLITVDEAKAFDYGFSLESGQLEELGLPFTN